MTCKFLANHSRIFRASLARELQITCKSLASQAQVIHEKLATGTCLSIPPVDAVPNGLGFCVVLCVQGGREPKRGGDGRTDGRLTGFPKGDGRR